MTGDIIFSVISYFLSLHLAREPHVLMHLDSILRDFSVTVEVNDEEMLLFQSNVIYVVILGNLMDKQIKQ